MSPRLRRLVTETVENEARNKGLGKTCLRSGNLKSVAARARIRVEVAVDIVLEVLNLHLVVEYDHIL